MTAYSSGFSVARNVGFEQIGDSEEAGDPREWQDELGAPMVDENGIPIIFL